MSTLPPLPVPPLVSALSGHVQNFLGQRGFPVLPYTLNYGAQRSEANFQSGWTTPGEVFIAPGGQPGVQSLAARYGKRGRMNWQQTEAARLMLHEGLHQMRFGRTPPAPGPINQWEEGATEAVTRDLLPIFLSRIYGYKTLPDRRQASYTGAYSPEVTQVRQLSTYGSGAAAYWKQPARVWRRTFLHADADARQRMADAALAMKAAKAASR